MPLDPNIALQVRGLELPNPLAQLAQTTQIQGAMQQQQLAGMQIKQLEEDRREMMALQQKLSSMGANPDLRAVAQTLMRSPKTLQVGVQMLEKLKEQDAYAAYLKRGEAPGATAPVAPAAAPAAQPAGAVVSPVPMTRTNIVPELPVSTDVIDANRPMPARQNALAPQPAEAMASQNALLDRGLRTPDMIRRQMAELAQFPNIPAAKAQLKVLETELAEAVKVQNVAPGGVLFQGGREIYRRPAELPSDVRIANWYMNATPAERQAYDASQAARRQQINIDQRQEGALVTQLGKEQAEAIAKGREGALSAVSNLETINTGRQLLKEGVLTGTGAEFLVNLNQALKTLGIDAGYADAAANSQAFTANMASSVGQLIKQFGAGTGLSNADREYAEKMAGGKITLDEKAIRRILDINERASRNVIATHNKFADKAGKAADAFKVEEPTFAPVDLPPIPAPVRSTTPRLRGAAAGGSTQAPAPAAGGVVRRFDKDGNEIQ